VAPQASSLSIKNDGQDARRHQILSLQQGRFQTCPSFDHSTKGGFETRPYYVWRGFRSNNPLENILIS